MTSKIELGKTYKTRDGDTVQILSVSRSHPTFPVAGDVRTKDGKLSLMTFTETGSYYGMGRECGRDLVEDLPEVAVYCNIYGGSIGPSHATARQAAAHAASAVIGMLKLTCKAGKPVSVEIL